MKRIIFCVAIVPLFITAKPVIADPGDTLIVQTYTFEEQNNPETDYDSPGRRWFDLAADDGTEYQKILMYYTLKCFEDGTAGGLGFDCGEWDYTSHTFLYEHTGLLDSNALTHPRYLANNIEFETENFSSIPLVDIYDMEFSSTEISEILSENAYLVNSSLDQELLLSSGTPGRVQFFYSEEELSATGLADSFNKLSLNFGGESTLSNFSVKLAWLPEAPVDFLNTDLSEVYSHPSFSFSTGQKDILLNNSTSWDGSSGLLLDLSYDYSVADFQLIGSSGNSLAAADIGNSYILFDGEDQVSIPPSIFSELDDEVSIGYWLYGTEGVQPENGTTFEGVNEANERVLNVHNPWGNGRVYWDAGQDGGYDRIDEQADEEDYSGQWNHWAFTKNNVSGEMKIYLNGEEWHSGTNKDNSLAGISKFNIGSAAGWSNYYRGGMDNFFILNKELSQNDILEYMDSDYSNSLPYADNLLGYYSFNHSYGEPVLNEVSDEHGLSLGDAQLSNYLGSELNSTLESSVKPWLSLCQGEYVTETVVDFYELQLEHPPVSVVEYAVNGNEIEVISYQSLYPEAYSVHYDLNGSALDSVSNSLELPITINNETLNYFSPEFEVVNRIELGRFITPYGIGLDLEEGWTWVYDVTDFEPLLRGEVELEAGNWQELLDLKFLYIEGTPPRDVKRVENIWAGNWQLSSWDDTVLEQSFNVEEGEDMFKVRATTSGHWFGQGNNCAEFCSNTHDLKINGNTEYSWEMMQECADNPLYPQGGTWIYDRAGWCPGAPVTTRELELTPYINSEEFTLEYDIDYDPYGNYWLMAQLFSYGGYNHQLDPEITQVLAPSDFKINSRINPICDNPVVRITNKGALPLNSLEFSYGINGQMESFTWQGSLDFMESEDVVLNYSMNQNFYAGNEDESLEFEVEISQPNGSVDENQSNNYANSHFFRPPTYSYDEDEDDNRIIIETRTNNVPSETQVQLKTLDGSSHWTSNYTEANTLYRDTLTLNAGCWLLHITDSDDDGLDFFANNDGSGYVRIKEVGGWYFKMFEDNFGKELLHYFNFDTNIFSGIDQVDEPIPSVQVYPNPSRGLFYLKGINLLGQLEIAVYDSSGSEVKSLVKTLNSSSDRIAIDLSLEGKGLYNLVIKTKDKLYSSRVISQ